MWKYEKAAVRSRESQACCQTKLRATLTLMPTFRAAVRPRLCDVSRYVVVSEVMTGCRLLTLKSLF